MSAQLKRRDFITLLGGAAAWPLAARAQPVAGKVPIILSLPAPDDIAVAALAPTVLGRSSVLPRS